MGETFKTTTMIKLSAKKFDPDLGTKILGDICIYREKPLSLLEKKQLINKLFIQFPDMQFFVLNENHNGLGPMKKLIYK